MFAARIISLVCLLLAACGGPDIELGGGRLLALDEGEHDGGARDGGGWDGPSDGDRHTRTGEGGGEGDGSGDGDGDGDGDGPGDGVGGRSGASSDSGASDAADAGAGRDAGTRFDGGGASRCDPGGPYCTADGGVFADECAAERAGARDAYECPWVEP